MPLTIRLVLVDAADGCTPLEGFAILAQLSLQTDGIFRDGSSLQMATVTGDVTNGYVASLTVAIEV